MLTGLAFFIKGSNFWKGYYAIGVAWYLTAGVMAWGAFWTWAPFGFGLLAAVSSVVIGIYERQMANEQ